MRRTSQGSARRADRAAAGFSLIEALIATGILLFIAIGIIPLFATSILNNSRGSDSTTATNHSRSQLEDMLQIPFSAASLTLPGSATQATTQEWWAPGNTGMMNDAAEGWMGAQPTSGFVPWTRTTTVTQYSVAALDAGALGTGAAELGSTPPNNVHLKQVQVEVDSGKQGLVSGEKVTIQVVKAF